ncbi:hypothetical protein ATL45_2805 [Saccharopolyspora antimicrobica]|uniref:Uncharacterized protein n=1 Tax=Saccharopolyspora antimicrobica TaxID=455193 RepID=A0ABX9TBT7_9PSEU|nr:hypothetical protein ATL45_2805 [Saccharopolyspora antimicrobica]
MQPNGLTGRFHVKQTVGVSQERHADGRDDFRNFNGNRTSDFH